MTRPKNKRIVRLATACALGAVLAGGARGEDPPADAPDPAAAQLAREVAGKGWLLFAAPSAQGDFDLFLCRPDGSARRNLTNSPEFNEFGGRFFHDGKRMLYRRLPKVAKVSHDLWGERGELVIANADGSQPVVQGKDGELPWASWSPDGRRFACLHKREGKIRIVDAATKQVLQEMPRQGIYQHLFWSPDGRRLCGTANVKGADWNILSIELETGHATLLSRNLNCTPDWFQGDATRCVYSNRTPGIGGDYGFTMLMQAAADGKSRALIYGERGRHIYYGCTSPDDRYVVFARPISDGGLDGTLVIVRLADTPIVVPADYQELKALYPGARAGPAFHLPHAGFEPHWTYAEIGGKP